MTNVLIVRFRYWSFSTDLGFIELGSQPLSSRSSRPLSLYSSMLPSDENPVTSSAGGNCLGKHRGFCSSDLYSTYKSSYSMAKLSFHSRLNTGAVRSSVVRTTLREHPSCQCSSSVYWQINLLLSQTSKSDTSQWPWSEEWHLTCFLNY